MYRRTTAMSGLTALLLIVVVWISPLDAHEKNWQQLSTGIKMALQSDNQGLKESAIYLIIRHGTKIDLDDSLEDLVKFYRDQQTDQKRQLVLLAIYRLDRDRAYELLNEQFASEQKEVLKFMKAVYGR